MKSEKAMEFGGKCFQMFDLNVNTNAVTFYTKKKRLLKNKHWNEFLTGMIGFSEITL